MTLALETTPALTVALAMAAGIACQVVARTWLTEQGWSPPETS